MIKNQDLSRIYWVCGSTCAGKSTISQVIADEMNWNIYHCDDWFTSHTERSVPYKHPTFHKISHVSGDELWLRPLEEQIKTEQPFCDDEFDLIQEDLTNELAKDERNLVFDGYVSPHILAELLPNTNRVFYLIATKDFQLHHYQQRDWIHEVLAKTSNKELAWHNWMQRDFASARQLEKQVEQFSMPHMLVDGAMSIEETLNLVNKHFLNSVDTNS